MSFHAKLIEEASFRDRSDALRGNGLILDYGACRVKVTATTESFEKHLNTVYRAFTFCAEPDFSDIHVRLTSGTFLRRFIRPNVHFKIDGFEPFDPFPLSSALPLYEWGVNWCFAQRFNQYVLLHAGSLALDNRAVVMAALPGSGKSTLSAALMLSGFRLLSDEFGVLDPASGNLLPMIKPVALKNRSIDVIRAFSKEACLGPTFTATRKGNVAHLAPDMASAQGIRHSAKPALIIFPKYQEGTELSLKPQASEQAFARLAFNSFNYALLGPVSFSAVANLAASCPAYELRYSRLEEAIACIRNLLLESGGS